MQVGDCYSMLNNGNRIRFRLIKYMSIDDSYHLRLCGEAEEIILYGLTIENVNSLQEINCFECDGNPSATEQLRE